MAADGLDSIPIVVGKQAGRLAALRTHITALKGSHSHCKAAQKEAQLKVFQS